MEQPYSLVIEEQTTPVDLQLIRQGLAGYNRQFARDDNFRPLNVLARDVQGELIGGLLGYLYWGWLYVDLLWVHESMRHQGVGSELLITAETAARKAGFLRVHLDTMGFQALPFYQKHGYTIWGQLDNFIDSHARYYLKKALTDYPSSPVDQQSSVQKSSHS